MNLRTEMSFHKSKVLRICADTFIKQGTKYGPYPGEANLICGNDTEDINDENVRGWMEFVPKTNWNEEANLKIIYCNGHMFFEALKDIEPSVKLVVIDKSVEISGDKYFPTLETQNGADLKCCQVCNGIASGINFSVLTCNKCKVFFRKSISSGEVYKCKRRKVCCIRSNVESKCSSCWLQKCRSAGMKTNQDTDSLNDMKPLTRSRKLQRCKICCRNIATGVHFSVSSCDECKEFFSCASDNISLRESYKCDKSRRCQRSLTSLLSCNYCKFLKCESVGMTNRPQSRNIVTREMDSSSSNITQCAICQDTASGYNFTVMTCDHCKIFFEKAFLNSFEYECKNVGKCIITKTTRLQCDYCRLQKCRAAGMKTNTQISYLNDCSGTIDDRNGESISMLNHSQDFSYPCFVWGEYFECGSVICSRNKVQRRHQCVVGETLTTCKKPLLMTGEGSHIETNKNKKQQSVKSKTNRASIGKKDVGSRKRKTGMQSKSSEVLRKRRRRTKRIVIEKSSDEGEDTHTSNDGDGNEQSTIVNLNCPSARLEGIKTEFDTIDNCFVQTNQKSLGKRAIDPYLEQECVDNEYKIERNMNEV